MDFFKKTIKYIVKLCFALILTPTLIILANNITNDSLIKMISNAQNSNWYKDYFILTNPCESDISYEKKDGKIRIMDTYFTNSLGSCYIEKLNDINKVEIDLNFGGRTTSALILSREIQNKAIDVQVNGECFSACVDVLMHGKNRFVCENAIVGIHQQSSKFNHDWLNIYLKRNNEYSMRKYKEMGINLDLVLEIINKTPSDEMYELSNKELLETGIATEIISCKDYDYGI